MRAEARSPPGGRSRRWLRFIAIALLAAGVAVVDLLSGPFVWLPIAFVIPVLLAARLGNAWAYALAFLAPLPRIAFQAFWTAPWPWTATAVNGLVSLGVLLTTANLMARIAQQRQVIARLRELVPICAFCKKVRAPTGEWERVEQFVSRRQSVDFSHTYCPECLVEHFPDQADLLAHDGGGARR